MGLLDMIRPKHEVAPPLESHPTFSDPREMQTVRRKIERGIRRMERLEREADLIAHR